MKLGIRPRMGPVGIDVGSRSFEVVQLRRIGEAWRLAAATSLPRQTPGADLTQAELERLSSVLYRQGFRGRQVVLAVPKDKLMSAILELPPKSASVPLEQIARIEFARVQKCEPASFEMAYWELPASARQGKLTNVMAVGCKYNDSDSMLSTFETGDFDVVRLDSRAAAVARACASLLRGGSRTGAILDLGSSSASLFIVREGLIVYDRVLVGAGLQRVEKVMAKQFDLNAEAIDYVMREIGLRPSRQNSGPARERLLDAVSMIATHFEGIIKDIEISFTYAKHQYPDSMPDRLLLVGGGATVAGLSEHLNNALKIDARVVTPAELVTCPPQISNAANPAFVAALGLALSGGAL